MKIVRNVGIVCSAIAGVAKVADMFGVFGGGGATHGSTNGSADPLAAPNAAAAETAGPYDKLPAQRKPLGGGYPADDVFDVPALTGDTAFLCTGAGTVVAYDVLNGKARWTKKTTAFTQTPALDDAGTVVYIAEKDGVLALSQKDGSIVRRFPYPSGLTSTGSYQGVGVDGTDIVALCEKEIGLDYVVVRFHASGGAGRQIAVPDLQIDVLAVSGLLHAPGRIYGVSATDVYRIDTTTGAVQSTGRTSASGFPKLLVSGKLLYMSNTALTCYNADDLTQLHWTFVPKSDEPQTAMVNEHFTVGDKNVYVTAWDSTLYAIPESVALTPQTLKKKVDGSYDQLAYANGVLYAGHNAGTGLVALDPATGEARWHCALPVGSESQLSYSPVVNEKVAVLAVDSAVGAKTNHMLYVVPLGS